MRPVAWCVGVLLLLVSLGCITAQDVAPSSTFNTATSIVTTSPSTTNETTTDAPVATNTTQTSTTSITQSPATQQPTTSPITTETPATLSPSTPAATTDTPTQAPTSIIPITQPTVSVATSQPTSTPTTPTTPTSPSECPVSTRSIHDGTANTAYRVNGPSLDDNHDFLITLTITITGQEIWQPILIHQSDNMWGANRTYTQFLMYVQKQGINDARQLCVNMGHGVSSSSLCSDNIISLNTPYSIMFSMTESVGRLYVSQAIVAEMTLPAPFIASNQSQWAIGIYSEPTVGMTYFHGILQDVMINSQCILPQLSSIVVFGTRFTNMIWALDQYNTIQLAWTPRWNGTLIQYPVKALLPTVEIEMMPRLNPPLVMTIPNTGSITINLMNEFISRGSPVSWIQSLFTQDTKIWFTVTSVDKHIIGSSQQYTLQYPTPSYDSNNQTHMIRTALRVSLALLTPTTTLDNNFQHIFVSQLSTCLSMDINNMIITSIAPQIRPQSIKHIYHISSNDEVTGITLDLLYDNETRWDGSVHSKSMWLSQSLELNGIVADLASQLSNTSSDIYQFNYTRLLSSSITFTPIIYCADMNNMNPDCLRPSWLVSDTIPTSSSSSNTNSFWIIGVAIAGGLVLCFMIYLCIRSYRTRKASESPEMARFRAMTASSLQMEPSNTVTVADSHYAFVSRDPGMSVSASNISRQISLASWARDTGMSISQRDIGMSISQRDPALTISPLVGWSGEYVTRSGDHSSSASPRVEPYAPIPTHSGENSSSTSPRVERDVI